MKRVAKGVVGLALLLIAADPQESEFHEHHDGQKTMLFSGVFHWKQGNLISEATHAARLDSGDLQHALAL